jgi:hypothetical protein
VIPDAVRPSAWSHTKTPSPCPKMSIVEDSSVVTNHRSSEETGSPGFSVHPSAEKSRSSSTVADIGYSSCVSPPPVRPAHSRFELLNCPDGGREVKFLTVRPSVAQLLLFGRANKSNRNHPQPITNLLRQTSRFCRYDLFLRALVCLASPLCRNSKIFPLDQARATA